MSFGVSHCRTVGGGTAGIFIGLLSVRTCGCTSGVLQVLMRTLQSHRDCVGVRFRVVSSAAGILEQEGCGGKGLSPVVYFAKKLSCHPPVIILVPHQRSPLCVMILSTVPLVHFLQTIEGKKQEGTK